MTVTKKHSKAALFNRIFSIAGLSIGGVILIYLLVYVKRTMDLRALVAQVQPGWLLLAALCIPFSESVDALLFYAMGRSAGCPMKLTGCFDAAYIGEFYYKLGPAGAPVQLKLMYDAGMSATYTASIYTWKAVANTMVYTVYAVAALLYEVFWRQESLGAAVAGAGVLIALYLFLCGLAVFTAIRPAPIQRLIRRILTFLSRHWKVMAKEGMVDKGMNKVDEFCHQLRAFQGNKKMLVWLYAGMFVELTALFAIPYFLYRGLGLTGVSFWELVMVQCLVMVLSRIIMLPGNAGGAEGSFYLFMSPIFGEHLAVGLVLWRFASFLEVLLLGGAWSVGRFAKRSAARHHPHGKEETA
ncbi:lysylphosphatidylglycerol synthase transmembrane domain-containing protein [Flavonifractor sp. AGMB03687]|uniref:lysylphosphatidylglycerol synthase transmembrane domain-containing protein n=1 Tax=Flavonifractor sp. AGMB03687 TaxID=2785133 RepID=UPI001ADF3ACD